MTTQTETKTEQGTETGLSEITLNLVALGAAIGANAERAFRAHQSRLTELGVSKEDMIEVVNMALRVKGDPHSILMALAQSTLTDGQAGGGCCGGSCACEEAGEEKGSCGEDCDCK
jgi:alkylhydroperoxidase/carboxymuconolactone decarboxylase family protein YurZ